MYQRILVPIDGSPTSLRGLEVAVRLAMLTKGRLRLMHVVDDLSFALCLDAYGGKGGDWLGFLRDNGARVLEQAKSAVAACGVGVETMLSDNFSGPVHLQVTVEAGRCRADLIVPGAHGRRSAGRLVLARGAENILCCSTVPVLLAPLEVKAAAAPRRESEVATQ